MLLLTFLSLIGLTQASELEDALKSLAQTIVFISNEEHIENAEHARIYKEGVTQFTEAMTKLTKAIESASVDDIKANTEQLENPTLETTFAPHLLWITSATKRLKKLGITFKPSEQIVSDLYGIPKQKELLESARDGALKRANPSFFQRIFRHNKK
jgi:hypothetical protein